MLLFKNKQILIIDEVSMLSAAQWGQINTILIALKQTKEMWGGMIVVFAGDYS